ncbi:hypothetical protein ACFL6I_14430 [candidate division KSB1 bacterium]
MKTATSIPAEIRSARRDIEVLTGDVHERVFLQSAIIPLIKSGRQIYFNRRIPIEITDKTGR